MPVNGTLDDATNVTDTLKNLSTSSSKNDTNNNIPVSKSSSLNESTDAEDTDSSYNNDRTNSVSYYNSNTLNGEKLLKNKPSSGTGSDTETSQKFKSTEATGGAKIQPLQKKSKDDIKNVKIDEKGKDKPKKADEKVAKNSKDAVVDKPKVPASPSKNKKSEDKPKTPETTISNSLVPANLPNSGDEKEPKVKNDKKTELEKSAQGVGLDQNTDKKLGDEIVSLVIKSEKAQPNKKTSTSALGGKTSPMQNGKQAANVNKAAKRQATEKALQKISKWLRFHIVYVISPSPLPFFREKYGNATIFFFWNSFILECFIVLRFLMLRYRQNSLKI